MSRIKIGKVALNPKGNWVSTTTYEKLDMVISGGKTFVARDNVPVGTTTSTTTYWQQMVNSFESVTTTTVSASTGASASIIGTPDKPILSLQIPRGVSGNESIDDTKGAGDTDYVWSADKLWNEVNSKAPVIVESASGDIVTIADGANLPVESLSVEVTPVQDLHGYDAPWPAGGGKNLLPLKSAAETINEVTLTPLSDGTLKVNGTANGLVGYTIGEITVPAGTYGFSGCPSSPNGYRQQWKLNGESVAFETGSEVTKTLAESGTLTAEIVVINGTQMNNVIFKPMIRNTSGTDATFAPYSNICPISGHTQANATRTAYNVWGGEKMADDIVNAINDSSISEKGTDSVGKYVTVKASSTTGSALFTSTVKFKENTQYSFVVKYKRSNTNKNLNIRFRYTDGTYSNLMRSENPVADTVYTEVYTSAEGKTIRDVTGVNGSQTTTFYYESCGIFEGVLTTTDFTPYQGVTLSIPFGQTVYEATVYPLEGKMVVDKGLATMNGSETWSDPVNGAFYTEDILPSGYTTTSPANWVTNSYIPTGYIANSSQIPERADKTIFNQSNGHHRRVWIKDTTYATKEAFTASLVANPVQLLYSLPTPTVITGLTPAILRTLLGYNAIWADCGAVDVQYRADTKLYTDAQIEARTNAVKRIMTTTTNEMKAPKNLVSGDIIIVNDDLYKATANIASGATLTVSTNVIQITLAEWVAALVA